jgi:hypothetical protein
LLILDDRLSTAALIHLRNMAELNFMVIKDRMAHRLRPAPPLPDGVGELARMSVLAMPLPKVRSDRGWMQSAGHRWNMR